MIKDAFLLGIVQGITEWLPISSSGHLAIFHNFCGLHGDISLDIFLHLSSLCVLIIFLHKDIIKLMKALLKKDFSSYSFKLIIYLISATFVTGILGFMLRKYIETITIQYLPFAFLFTSIILFLSVRKGKEKIDIKKSLFIGLIQGLALIPGVSRSGSTISAAKILGVDDYEAFNFSFLLAIPAILGAVLYELKNFHTIHPLVLITGFFTSFVVGIISLSILRKIVVKGKLYLFGFYTLFLSVLLLIIS